MPKIMVLDDDAALRRSLLVRLQTAGFDVLDAEHPESAIDTIIRERPDLILLDIEMPHYNGLEFQECLQFSERAREIPIIYVSGAGTPPNRQDAFRMGARAFVAKPYDPHELIATIRGVLAATVRNEQPADA